jgi:hypothetical protein
MRLANAGSERLRRDISTNRLISTMRTISSRRQLCLCHVARAGHRPSTGSGDGALLTRGEDNFVFVAVLDNDVVRFGLIEVRGSRIQLVSAAKEPQGAPGGPGATGVGPIFPLYWR